MTKNDHNPETLLAKAEKFFKKGNYLLAKSEFEKAANLAAREDILTKIETCNREIEKLQARDLVKRARKHVKKNNPKEALICFEEAHRITGEDWIRERIQELSGEVSGHDIDCAAKTAEAAGDYPKAAELYEEAFANQNKEEFLRKQALCLVKAEKHGEAVRLFKDMSLSDNTTRYYYGFSLAKTGRYHESLKTWDGIDSENSEFLKQKKISLSLLAPDLYNRLYGAERTADFYEEVKYLQDSNYGLDNYGLVGRITCAMIEELWKEERFEDIEKLLPNVFMDIKPSLLAIHAKTFFKLAESSVDHLPGLTLIWLTSLFDPEIYDNLSPNLGEREKVRRELVQMAENAIKKQADSGSSTAKREWVYWNVEKKLVEDIHALAGKSNVQAPGLLTPRFAWRSGQSAHMLMLIRANKDHFKDNIHYLETGAWYSAAGPSLYHLENAEPGEALAELPKKVEEDEFFSYGATKVKFFYGLDCIETGKGRPERYFQDILALIIKAPKYEQLLLDKTKGIEHPGKIQRFEELLGFLYGKRPTKRLGDALSLFMTMRAIDMWNLDKLSAKALDSTLKKALALNPENEMAAGELDTSETNLEVEAIANAMNKFKFKKASQLALSSKHDKVRDWFFENLEELFETSETMKMNKNEKSILYNDIYRACERVDSSHPLLDDVSAAMKEIKT